MTARHTRAAIAVLAMLSSVAACKPPAGTPISHCTSGPTGIFTTTTKCVFTMSPLDTAGKLFFHEEKALGTNSAYTDAIAVKGTLSVFRGEARLQVVDEQRETRTITATPGAPASFDIRMKTALRFNVRGLEFQFRPGGPTQRADSVRLAYEFTR